MANLFTTLKGHLGFHLNAPRPPVSPSVDQTIERLGLPFSSVLFSMYAGSPQMGMDGCLHAIDATTRISPVAGLWLFDLCRSVRPRATFEIGLAYGFSTVYFLAAIKANDMGEHTALDPFQPHWHGVGLTRAKLLKMEKFFHFTDELSVVGLVRLSQEKAQYDLLFIDGNHRFDDVLVDFTLAANICGVGGHIILDDMWMPSVRKTAAFIRRNRGDFVEVPCPVPNFAVFQMIDKDKRDWDHFVDFN
jgi:predicted O-methyltransferase YrrM